MPFECNTVIREGLHLYVSTFTWRRLGRDPMKGHAIPAAQVAFWQTDIFKKRKKIKT